MNEAIEIFLVGMMSGACIVVGAALFFLTRNVK